MDRLLRTSLLLTLVGAFVALSPSPGSAKAVSTGDQAFANPDELGDCPVAPPAFSGNFHWEVYRTANPGNPAGALINPANTDTYTVVIAVTNDLLLDLPAECDGGPYNGDPNPGDLAKVIVSTFNFGAGDFTFPTVGQYGTVDDADPSTPAPSGYLASMTAMEFHFDSPSIDAGEVTQLVFFTIPSIERGETAYFTVQSTSGSVDDKPFVPIPSGTVATEAMSWGLLKSIFR